MIGVDHPLTAKGVQQAQLLRRNWQEVVAEYQREASPDDMQAMGPACTRLDQWLAADEVLCSPLTRAVQTAMLSLEGHPRLCSGPIRLLGSIREVKGYFGLDNIGTAVGGGIETRALQELHALQQTRDLEATTDFDEPSCSVDSLDVHSPWWTRSWDSSGSLDDRMYEFMEEVRDHPAQSMIVVGHSLWFREFVKRFQGHRTFAFASQKLANCACVALDIQFGPECASIACIELMFGSAMSHDGV